MTRSTRDQGLLAPCWLALVLCWAGCHNATSFTAVELFVRYDTAPARIEVRGYMGDLAIGVARVPRVPRPLSPRGESVGLLLPDSRLHDGRVALQVVALDERGQTTATVQLDVQVRPGRLVSRTVWLRDEPRPRQPGASPASTSAPPDAGDRAPEAGAAPGSDANLRGPPDATISDAYDLASQATIVATDDASRSTHDTKVPIPAGQPGASRHLDAGISPQIPCQAPGCVADAGDPGKDDPSKPPGHGHHASSVPDHQREDAEDAGLVAGYCRLDCDLTHPGCLRALLDCLDRHLANP